MRCVLSLILLTTLVAAQEAGPAFEAASVKVNNSGPAAPNGFSPSAGGLRVTNMPLRQLIQAAYHVKTGMLFGVVGWMDSDRYDIDARTSRRADFDEEIVMLRALLEDRFGLKFHRETRQLNMHVLVTGKGGPKFQATKDQDQKESVRVRLGEISGTAIPFGHFVTLLEAQLGYPMMNDTRLHGAFDLSLKYSLDNTPGSDPSVFAALEDIGLKLEARKAPAEVFVIDSATRPGQN
jgi:uncharacterized protein (TIGR03435 family)